MRITKKSFTWFRKCFKSSFTLHLPKFVTNTCNYLLYGKFITNWNFLKWRHILIYLITLSRLEGWFVLLSKKLFWYKRRKYFCAWLATWVGVFVVTNSLDISLHLPFPSFSSPLTNNLFSSSVHAIPEHQKICYFNFYS